jgi:cysteine desulfurase/selenocysteine lyase
MMKKTDFPILSTQINGHPLIYLDSAATSQKPQQVLDALTNFYTQHNANVHRAVYHLGEDATQLYENARETVANFINAQPEEIIFTKGTTESINFVAATWAAQHLKTGDEIVLTELEHHSNLIPWQQIACKVGAILKFIPVNKDGTLDCTQLPTIINHKTKLVSVTHISHALGTQLPLADIIVQAQQVGAKVVIDAAQSVPHQTINVKTMGCDFLAFSGHKMLGPTGIGVLYIKKELHDALSPYQFGGGMVYEASFTTATFLKAPHKFEAGTPPIAQAVGLAAAINYLTSHDMHKLQQHEALLCAKLIEGLQTLSRVKILGPIDQLKKHGHLVSFTVDGMHSHDVAAYLGSHGICVRAGHHCAQPLAKKLGLDASVRVSFYGYNTIEEVEILLQVMQKMLV